MGDRVIFIVRSGQGDYSPAIYAHSLGSAALALLAEAAPTMREMDESYGAARLCGYLHEQTSGSIPLGLGLFEGPKDLEPETLEKFSHGDAGVILVDLRRGADPAVTVHGGYLSQADVEKHGYHFNTVKRIPWQCKGD